MSQDFVKLWILEMASAEITASWLDSDDIAVETIEHKIKP